MALTFVDDTDTANDAFKKIESYFSDRSEVIARSLSTPGPFKTIRGAKLHWLDEEGLWAYFNEIEDRYHCWFGTNPGENGETLSPAIEINIPEDGYDGNFYGALVKDDNERLFLAHKGGLGGGNRAVKIENFATLVRGFMREPVLLPDEKTATKTFVLGEIGVGNFAARLKKYVAEAERIRLLRTDEPRYLRGLEASGEWQVIADIKQLRKIRKRHGLVVNRLASLLSENNIKVNNKLIEGLGPDLYVLDSDTGDLRALFEVKVECTTQPIMTAIGQLLVYGAGRNPQRRILVAPAIPENPQFQLALEEHGISHLAYSFLDKKTIKFEDDDLAVLIDQLNRR